MVEFGRILVIIGLAITFSGLVILVAAKLFPGLNQMPGMFIYEGENFKIFFPLGAMILISILGTILLNVIIRLFR
ncbi:MAG: DUF2905 domain-containing protein [Chloroflexi bacterium]|nr:DUF2905 domain-containing protein [Ardenticatenaceae bacterium]MBL1129545.1 DUF2905 domain-containing protein [Chloroflexota bacterium]NOG35627.1 DUF2905 domain-containing protein [Chloroflexota bacterium]GIK58488.1 MAG: hypothetical protein BroJett015_41510 [Chloroflexota bacterium]